jgi:3-(3-hydroxy-phenyl)propionate hydroxylase
MRIEGREAWFLPQCGGTFTLIEFVDASGRSAVPAEQARAMAAAPIPIQLVRVAPKGMRAAGTLEDVEGYLAERYDARVGTVYLLRPDQHVAARWRGFDMAAVHRALARATGNAETTA